MTKKKIAVLGSGVGSMSTVWALTSLPNWQDRWEITVYQMGWRLGGKGASGRNPDYHQRIEEHGLHVWAGFYDNGFRVMREVYEAAARTSGPIRTLEDAFKPHSDIIIEEHLGDRWVPWVIQAPTNGELPGSSNEVPTIWSYLEMLLELILEFLHKSPIETTDGITREQIEDVFTRLTGGHNEPQGSIEGRSLLDSIGDLSVSVALEVARRFVRWMGPDASHHFRVDQMVALGLVESAFRDLNSRYRHVLDDHDEIRRLYYLLDMGLGIFKGVLGDFVFLRGWDALDVWDWPDWMRRWGVSEYTLKSVLVRSTFDYIFGYLRGDVEQPRVGAGTAVHGLLRLVLTYKGALFFEMQAGMGDIVFGPMYEVLAKRGVKFAFFHKITNLVVSADKKQVEGIEVNVQATVKGGLPYEPLIDVKGVPSWPSYPCYDQLDQGAQLKAQGNNLEYSWDPWPGVDNITLQRGVDFDEIVLGISVGAFPFICKEMMDANARFGRMVQGIKTVQTQAVQLWLDADAARMGAPERPPVVTGYQDPINTWADLSYLIEHEDWPDADKPKFLAYFCGPQEDAAYIPPFSDHDFPARETERVRQMAQQWFSAYTGHIWTNATTPQNPDGLDLELLHGPGSGEDKFKAQYFRSNFEPSERYVLSVPGSTSVRLKAYESGFGNVFLAGDWTYTSINAGCVECAVMSGLHAAEAISKDRFLIVDRAYENPNT